MNEKTKELEILSEKLERFVGQLDELEVMANKLRKAGDDSVTRIQLKNDEHLVTSVDIDAPFAIYAIDQKILRVKDQIKWVIEQLNKVGEL